VEVFDPASARDKLCHDFVLVASLYILGMDHIENTASKNLSIVELRLERDVA
jgi:hypothetical protein